MQDHESGLLRIYLPRTTVNKGKEKGRSCHTPAPSPQPMMGSKLPRPEGRVEHNRSTAVLIQRMLMSHLRIGGTVRPPHSCCSRRKDPYRQQRHRYDRRPGWGSRSN